MPDDLAMNLVIYVACPTQTLEYYFRRATNLTLATSDRLAPIQTIFYG